MPRRRSIIRAALGVTGTAAFGFGATTGGLADSLEKLSGSSATAARIEATEPAVEYVRNVEEVRGHFISAMTLLEQGRREDATLHAGHGSDYFGAVLTPLRDDDPELATRLRARIKTVAERVQSASPSAFRQYVTGEVFPLLEQAVNTVVGGSIRGQTSFDVRVMNALAGRIADEYGAAVTADGTIKLEGEYWDGRGFLVRIEQRYQNTSGINGAGTDALDQLRSSMEAVEPPAAVIGETLRFRVETTAAANLPSVRVEGRDDALTYVRNVEEVRGHLHSAGNLAAVGDSHASLHAGHASDYIMPILPAVQRADESLATTLFERMRAVDERVTELNADQFEQFVQSDVFPLLDQAVSTVVPDQFNDSTSFDAAVLLALGDRVADEYDAAVTESEVIELYGEYWDARGFLVRMEERFAGFESDLDSETRSEVEEELGILREELETARPPSDVIGSIEALHEMLGEVTEG